MEYVRGGDIYSLLQRHERIERNGVLHAISETVLAIQYLHDHNIIHRDIKPGKKRKNDRMGLNMRRIIKK